MTKTHIHRADAAVKHVKLKRENGLIRCDSYGTVSSVIKWKNKCNFMSTVLGVPVAQLVEQCVSSA